MTGRQWPLTNYAREIVQVVESWCSELPACAASAKILKMCCYVRQVCFP